MRLAIGIDVGGTNTKYGVFTEAGRMIKKISLPTVCGKDGLYIFEQITEEVQKLKQQFSKGETYIMGIGIGMPGPVMEDGYVENCVNLNLKDVNPSQIIGKMLKDIPVTVGNDANVAALGEMWEGGAVGYDSIIVITLGTGVGSGIVLNRRILYGEKGLAGEIGHIIVNPKEKEICNCGKYGCLDQIASARGIVRIAERMMEFTDLPSELRQMRKISARKVAEAAKKGDALSYLVLDYCMSFLGKCLADVSYVIDPQVFVIGGGVSQAGSFLTDMIQRHYEKNATLIKNKTPVVIAKLGNDAGIYGAAKLAFDRDNAMRRERKIC